MDCTEKVIEPKKKRGRKPKNKEKDVDIPKKRGRKPKNNIIINDNPVFDGNYNEDITVKLNMIDDKTISSVSGYNKVIDYQDISINNKSNASEICWNCSYKLNNIIYGMPIKYINKIFYTYGDFCCNCCALRYAYDNYCDSNYYNIKSNIYLRNKINDIDNIVNLPPSKFTLQHYGGELSHEEYIDSKDNYNIDLSNCIHINHIFSKNDNKIENTTNINSELKLYRKNNIFKNDINKLLNID